MLIHLLERMMDKISEEKSISFSDVDPKEFKERYGNSALIVGKYLKSNLGNDFIPQLRDSLYFKNPTSCDLIDRIVDLARPQRDGKPLESIITFNFDNLIEEQLDKNNIKYKSICAEGMRNKPKELPIYHVHGFLPRKGKIGKDSEVVFSEDSYHSQFIDPFSWSNLIQLNKLNQNTCLLLGLSLTDPNLRRLLDVSNRKNPLRSRNHFFIKKRPCFSNKSDAIDQLAFILEEEDASELGLNTIWVDDFPDIPLFLKEIVIYDE